MSIVSYDPLCVYAIPISGTPAADVLGSPVATERMLGYGSDQKSRGASVGNYMQLQENRLQHATHLHVFSTIYGEIFLA